MVKNQIYLPYGMGRFTTGWIIFIILLLTLIAFGVFGYIQQFNQGEYLTGLRNIGAMNGATWGLYVVMYVYLMGLSFAGITFAVIVNLFKIARLRPLARMAEALTVFSIISGALLTIADVGQPLRALVNLLKYARPQSPFFGTFTLVIAGYLFASLVYLFLEGRKDAAALVKINGRFTWLYRFWASGYADTPSEQQRRERSNFWLSIAMVPLLITATSTLGFVFGLQVGRPGWFSSLQAPGFVVLASLSGIGMLIIIAAILRKTLGLENQLKEDTFLALANVMMVLNIIYVYFTIVEWLSSFYSVQHYELRINEALHFGEYAPLFWTTIAFLVLPMFLLIGRFIFQKFSLPLLVFCGILVNLAAIGKRYLIVVPSQTHGMLLPYGIGTYNPTWIEYSVVLGLIGLATLLYTLFIKVFPILEVNQIVEGVD